MAKRTKQIKNRPVTKTEGLKGATLVVQELNIMAADRSRKDIGDLKRALESAESVFFPVRAELYDIYETTVLDGFLTGIMSKREDGVLNKTIYFETSAGKREERMDEVIQSNTFRGIIREILKSKAWGIRGLEFEPGPELCYKVIPPKHIKPHKKIIAIDQYDDTGISYDGVSNLWVIGDENDLGYLLKCSLYATYKRGGLGDYAQYIEIFGQPVRVIYYDANDVKTKKELRQVLNESGSSLAMMIPRQASFEMKDGKQSNANGDLQLKYLNFCNDEMGIIVLGNTETTKSSSSSGYAQSKEHGKQQLEITKSDLVFVRNMLNTPHFINILKSYGLPVEGGKFVFEKEIDLEALNKRLGIDSKVSEKVPVGDDYWYETYGIPKPDNYDELKAKQEEERTAKLAGLQQQPPVPGNPAKPPKKKPKPSIKKDLKAANFWTTLRSQLADFFDPAP